MISINYLSYISIHKMSSFLIDPSFYYFNYYYLNLNYYIFLRIFYYIVNLK